MHCQKSGRDIETSAAVRSQSLVWGWTFSFDNFRYNNDLLSYKHFHRAGPALIPCPSAMQNLPNMPATKKSTDI